MNIVIIQFNFIMEFSVIRKKNGHFRLVIDYTEWYLRICIVNTAQ